METQSENKKKNKKGEIASYWIVHINAFIIYEKEREKEKNKQVIDDHHPHGVLLIANHYKHFKYKNVRMHICVRIFIYVNLYIYVQFHE